MCGRDTATFTWKQVHDYMSAFTVGTPAEDPVPTYNRAPTQQGWAVVRTEDGHGALPMRWGLLPPWAKDTKLAYSTINARLESVETKPAFRSAWKHRRALIPSSGYYEWMQLDARTKQPYFIRHAESPVMTHAGLWEVRRDDAGNELLTYSIITRDADQTVETIHDRMPLLLPPELHREWLEATPEDAMRIALAVPSTPLLAHPVGRDVGNVRNNGPQLVQPVAPGGLF